MFGQLSNTVHEDGTLEGDRAGDEYFWDGTLNTSNLKQPTVTVSPRTFKVNTWTERRIKKVSDEWNANRKFEEETMGEEPDEVAGWTDDQIQFENAVTVGMKGTRYREVHQHGKKKPQGAKATMEARKWEHTLQDSVWWEDIDRQHQAEIDAHSSKCICCGADELIDLFSRDGQRRRQHHAVIRRSHHETVLHGIGFDLAGDFRAVVEPGACGLVLGKLDTGDETMAPDFTDNR